MIERVADAAISSAIRRARQSVKLHPLVSLTLLAAGLAGAGPTLAVSFPTLSHRLAQAAPHADAAVIERAVTAMQCASAKDAAMPRRLAVIDYSRPSSERRLWLFDLEHRTLLDEEWVAHGQGSGENLPTVFSNLPGSHQSSLGLFRTGTTYVGRNGYSLRMDGLEPGINHRAAERAIVIHGADYVSEDTIRAQGRLGRSWGCPALRRSVARRVIDELAGDQYVYAYFPDPAWLAAADAACPPAGRSNAAPSVATTPQQATAARPAAP